MDDKILGQIADYCAGKLREKEGQELREWIEKTADNRKTFEKYLQLVKMHRMVEGETLIQEEKAWKELCGKFRHRRIKRLRLWGSMAAASVILALGLCTGIWMHHSTGDTSPVIPQIMPGTTKATLILANGSQVDLTREDLKEITEQGTLIRNDTAVGLQYELNKQVVEKPVWHKIEVPVAGEYHFSLPDGSKVWINSDSELVFPVAFTGDKREVFVKGEAYFEVEREEKRPFIVHANEVDICVLGTKFNVAAYGNSLQVVTTLREGSVNVGMGEKEILLKPGRQVIADRASGKMTDRPVETSMYLSWVKGIFEYENMPLSEIAVQLSRWYDVNFIFSAPEFKDRCFTGVVRKYEMLNEVLKNIEKTTNVSFMINGKDIAVKAMVR